MRLYLNAWTKKERTYELNSGIRRDEKKNTPWWMYVALPPMKWSLYLP